MAFRRTLPLLALALGLAAPLAAQDFHVGLQGSAALAMGDYHESTGKHLGYTAGLNASLGFGAGNAVRTRFDYTRVSGDLAGTGSTASAGTVLVEYVDYVHDKVEGPYLFGGLGWQRTQLRLDGAGSDNASAIAFDAGGGWQCSDLLAVELRFESSRPRFAGAEDRFRADQLDLGIVIRF